MSEIPHQRTYVALPTTVHDETGGYPGPGLSRAVRARMSSHYSVDDVQSTTSGLPAGAKRRGLSFSSNIATKRPRPRPQRDTLPTLQIAAAVWVKLA